MIDNQTLFFSLMGLVFIDAFLAAYGDWKLTITMKAAKGFTDGHFQALYKRIEDGEKALASLEETLKSKEEALNQRIDELDQEYASADVIDNVHDELFGIKSSVQQLGQDLSQKKKKRRKAGKRR